MTKITVDPLTTYNQTPTVTGTVTDLERFDKDGNAKHTIQVIVNYTTYKLFGGNLGLDESKSPPVWKLHFDYPLYPGTYEIEAQVIDVATNTIVAADDTQNELKISVRPTYTAYPKPPELSLFQKFQLVNALMKSMDRLFGGKNGISPVPSVHPVVDDQASTTELGRGKEERAQHPVPKSKDKTQKPNVNPKPKPQNFKVTDPGGGGGGSDPLASMTDEQKKQAAELAIKSSGGEIDDAGNIKMPEPLEELGMKENMPTTEQVMENLGVASTAQAEAPQGQPVYDAMGNFTGTYETPPAQEVFNPGGTPGLGGTYENQPDETVKEYLSMESNPADVDAALARAVATSEANKIPSVVDAYLK